MKYLARSTPLFYFDMQIERPHHVVMRFDIDVSAVVYAFVKFCHHP
jgi:hypothetical protein